MKIDFYLNNIIFQYIKRCYITHNINLLIIIIVACLMRIDTEIPTCTYPPQSVPNQTV